MRWPWRCRQKGFRVETEADLIELLGNRLRSGREIFGMATQSMEDVPLEMRGARRAAGPGPACKWICWANRTWSLASWGRRTLGA
jgi:hypothetical protein